MSDSVDSSNHSSPGPESRVPEVVVRSAQIAQLYSQVRTGMVASIVAAFALAALLWQAVPREQVLVWLVVFLAVQIPRHLLLQRFHRVEPQGADAIPWGSRFLLGSMATSLLFGMSAVVLFPSDSFVHQCVLAVFLGGFAASTAVAHAPLTQCYVSSVLLTLLPLLGRLLYQGGESGAVLAAVGLAFAAALLGTGNSLHKMIATSIRLRFQRDEMVRNLAQAYEMLEKRVVERTAELASRNNELSIEIVERKRAEEALRAEKARFQALAEHLPLGLVSISGEGKFLYVNREFRELFDYDLLDVPDGRHWFRMAYPDPEYRRHVISCWVGDLEKENLGEQRPREFNVTCKDGSRKTVLFRPVQLSSGEHLMTCADVTEQKRAERALEEHVSMMEAILEKAADGICVCHNIDEFPYVRFSHWNPRMSAITGYTLEEINQSGWYQTMYPDPGLRQAAIERMSRMRVGDDIRAEEWVITTKDGTVLPLSISTSVIKEEDGKVHVLAIIQDIAQRKKDEDALRDSEEKYRTLVEETFDGIFVQKDNKIVFANSRLCEMIGYSESELVGMDHWRIYHPDYHELTRSRAQGRMRGEQVPPRYEVRLRKKDGASFDAEINAKEVLVEGQPGVQVWVRDITERKKSEEALRDSEATLRTLVQAAPIGIGQVSADRTLGWTNQLLGTMLGYSTEELAGQSARILYESEEEFLRVGREKHPDVIRQGTGSLETRFKRKDGTAFDVLLSSSSVLPGDLSHGMVFTAVDITERKASEQQLQRLGAAVESAGETIVVTDSSGSIIYVNPAFEGITGYSRQEALGKNPRILKSGKHDRAFYREMWDTLLKGQVWRGRLTNRRKDGTLYEETATISPIRDGNGRISNYVAVKRDVTGETMLQNQLLHAQKMEAIGTLAGGMAHDFNNLLQAILGYSDLLHRKKAPNDPDRRKLEVIQQAARDGADLVGRILTFSRKGESKARPIDLNEEIRKAQKLLRRTVPRMIEIRLVLAENLQIIDADPAQVEQVLLNLAVNAQHAMPDGGQILIETSNVSLSDEYLRTHLGTQPGHYVLLTFSDTGVGIEPYVLDRIFEPFFTTKTNGEGTGLGLSMVHGIVSQHGGYVRCYSEPGRGTSFKIYFPVSAGEFISDTTLTREMPAFGTETILLVDDDDRIRDMGTQMIEIGGYEVIVARSGEEALVIYATKRAEISLVILDLNMPGMGGTRCLEELLRINPDIRVIVASGYSSNGLAKDEKGIGERGFISKPYDAKGILTAIRKVLDLGYL